MRRARSRPRPARTRELLVVGAEPLGDQRARAAARRSASWSKPIENVFTGSAEASAIAATTADESIPPERNAPSGTSAISRLRVASRSACADPLARAPRPARRRACCAVVELPVALAASAWPSRSTQRVRGRQLAHASERASAGRARSRRRGSGRARRGRPRAGSRGPAAARCSSEAKRQRRRRAARRTAASCRPGRAPAAAAGGARPRARSANMPCRWRTQSAPCSS